MARKKKLVTTLKHETGEVADIMIDPDSGEFSCTNRFIGEAVKGRDLDTVRAAVQARLDTLGKLVWEPVIEMERTRTNHLYGNSHQKSATVGLRIARYWIARRIKAPTLRSWPWEDSRERLTWDTTANYAQPVKKVETIDRLRGAEELLDLPPDYTLPYHVPKERWTHGDFETVYFAYDEHLWLALNELVKTITDAHAALAKIVGSENAGPMLLAWSSKIPRLAAMTDESEAD